MARTAPKSRVVTALEDGTFFVNGETPTGSINGSNKTFVLADTPNPADSLELSINGQELKLTSDYTLSGDTITTTFAYPTNSVNSFLADYRVEPA